jgi:hypothetical protein
MHFLFQSRICIINHCAIDHLCFFSGESSFLFQILDCLFLQENRIFSFSSPDSRCHHSNTTKKKRQRNHNTSLRHSQRFLFQRLANSSSSDAIMVIILNVTYIKFSHRPRKSTGMRCNSRSTPRIPPPAGKLISRLPPWPFRDHRSSRRQTRNHPCPAHPNGRKPFQRQAHRPTTFPRDGDGGG